MIQAIRTHLHDLRFQALVKELDDELGEMYGAQQAQFTPHNVLEENVNALLLMRGDVPVGIGAFREMEEKGVVEIKRMFVVPSERGKGLSKKILEELENWAREKQYIHAKLETGDKNISAIFLYEKTGYERIPPFGPYVDIPESICFGKKLKTLDGER